MNIARLVLQGVFDLLLWIVVIPIAFAVSIWWAIGVLFRAGYGA